MSEFFLELFSEEIPSSLQKNLREDLLDSFNILFKEKLILIHVTAEVNKININILTLFRLSLI